MEKKTQQLKKKTNKMGAPSNRVAQRMSNLLNNRYLAVIDRLCSPHGPRRPKVLQLLRADQKKRSKKGKKNKIKKNPFGLFSCQLLLNRRHPKPGKAR